MHWTSLGAAEMAGSVFVCLIRGRRSGPRRIAILEAMNRLSARAAGFLSPRFLTLTTRYFCGFLFAQSALAGGSVRAQTVAAPNAAHWVTLLETRYRSASTTQAT